MTTQLTDSLGATWTYYPEFDQWETDDDRNDTECDGCGGASTLDMDDFLEHILEDLKSELRSQFRSLLASAQRPWIPGGRGKAARQLETDLASQGAALQTRLLSLRTA